MEKVNSGAAMETAGGNAMTMTVQTARTRGIETKADGERGESRGTGNGGGWSRFKKSGGKAEAAEKREPLDVYKEVTDRILEKLEQGVVPWQSSSIALTGWPRNFATGRLYSGINVFLLAMAGFQSPHFLTFLQARELGGAVRKGEKGFPVIKAGTWEPKGEQAGTAAESATETGGEERSRERRFLRLYTVFNASQIDGIEFPEPERCETYTESERAEAAHLIVQGMPNRPKVLEGRKAFPHYLPDSDTVEMPGRFTFRAEWRYFKTLFHELAHYAAVLIMPRRRFEA